MKNSIGSSRSLSCKETDILLFTNLVEPNCVYFSLYFAVVVSVSHFTAGRTFCHCQEETLLFNRAKFVFRAQNKVKHIDVRNYCAIMILVIGS